MRLGVLAGMRSVSRRPRLTFFDIEYYISENYDSEINRTEETP
jgi:hypothetical protein